MDPFSETSFFPFTSDGTFKCFHAIHQSQRCRINDAPFPITERERDEESRGVGGGVEGCFENETLMQYEQRTCRNAHMHSLSKENTDAQLGRHLPPLQWSQLQSNPTFDNVHPSCTMPRPPHSLSHACNARHNSHNSGLRRVFQKPLSKLPRWVYVPRHATQSSLCSSCVYDHGRPKSLTAAKIQLTAWLHLRGCKAAVFSRYHEMHSRLTPWNTQHVSIISLQMFLLELHWLFW